MSDESDEKKFKEILKKELSGQKLDSSEMKKKVSLEGKLGQTPELVNNLKSQAVNEMKMSNQPIYQPNYAPPKPTR